MVEEQAPQEFELADRVVGCPRRLLALQPLDAHAHVRGGYHIHVVGAVTDRQRRHTGLVVSDQSFFLVVCVWGV